MPARGQRCSVAYWPEFCVRLVMIRIATFNAGLAVGILPNVTARLPHVLRSLSNLDVDLLFVQEFWLENHWEALRALVGEKLPYFVRQKGESMRATGCTQQ